MSRLFITERELDFISDITKEVIKDVIGQKIFYYKIREELTDVHDVYDESVDKVFSPPVELEALVEWSQPTVSTTNFGSEMKNTINVMIHQRDILDKDISIREGDYFSYGTYFFEITSKTAISKIFGQVEHLTGFKLVGKQAREGQIGKTPLGPLSDDVISEDAVQKEFTQQRGFAENSQGKTNDKRSLQEKEILEIPISQPRSVKKDEKGSSFYGDE